MARQKDGRQPGSVRIIAGEWRGRRLRLPAGTEVRPTPDRVRETVFNWLGARVVGSDCLDLFAGTGAFGFEALSRGARCVVFVEQDARLVECLEAHRAVLGTSAARIVRADVASFLRSTPRAGGAMEERHNGAAPSSFGIVFLDPPYRMALEPLLGPVLARLTPGGMIYVERPAADGLPEHPGLRWHRQARAGRVEFGLAVAA